MQSGRAGRVDRVDYVRRSVQLQGEIQYELQDPHVALKEFHFENIPVDADRQKKILVWYIVSLSICPHTILASTTGTLLGLVL